MAGYWWQKPENTRPFALKEGDEVVWTDINFGSIYERVGTVVEVLQTGKVRIVTTDDNKRHTVKIHNLKRTHTGAGWEKFGG